jgi:hypothetical protein
MSSQRDMLGRPLTAMELELLDVHTRLQRLAARGDLPPCVAAGTQAALGLSWQMANDLGLDVSGPDA